MKIQPVRYFKATIKKMRVLRKILKAAFAANDIEVAYNLIDRFDRIKKTV